MPGVQELQEIECLTAADLTEDDPVWAVAEGCLQEVTDANSRQAVLWLPGFEADEVVLVHLNFGCVFDEENSLVRGNEFPKDIQERCFPSSCASRLSGCSCEREHRSQVGSPAISPGFRP